MLAAAEAPPAFVTVRQGMTRPEVNTAAAALSRDGRYVAFVSYASLTSRGGARVPAIYVLDRATGAVTLESAPPGGCAPGRGCGAPSLSADGRFLTFETTVDAPAGGPPLNVVLLRDRRTRVTRRVGTSARGDPNGSVRHGSISADGRTVVFASTATNLLAAGDGTRAEDVFALDVASGSIRRVSVSVHGQPPGGSSFGPAVSGDGRFVVFTSTAPIDDRPARTVAGRPQADVYLHDLLTGRTARISARPDGNSPNGSSYNAAISDDGRYVAFVSMASDLVKHDRNQTSDVFVYDVAAKAISLVTRNGAGRTANGASDRPRLSSDGAIVVFESEASDLTCAKGCVEADRDINLLPDVFLFDRRSRATRRVSTGRASWEEPSVAPVIDGTGSVVAFSSRHPRDPQDTEDDFDLFVGGMNKGTVVASKNRSP